MGHKMWGAVPMILEGMYPAPSYRERDPLFGHFTRHEGPFGHPLGRPCPVHSLYTSPACIAPYFGTTYCTVAIKYP